MPAEQTFVIVGAGLAGAKAAEALREQGFGGRIVLFGEEGHRPYERPPLSKEYLQGKAERDSIFVHPPDWYREHSVELRQGTVVTAVDPAGHQVRLADGEPVEYDRLLLATGAVPLLLPVPGASMPGVLYLRSVEDSERIRDVLSSASRLVIVGAGWIGLEVAAAARLAGAEVTVVETMELPLLRVLGPELAPVFADLHRGHGVDLRLSATVAEILVADGAAAGVRLVDGTALRADAVVVGIGAAPRTDLAEAAGLDVRNGIVTDASLRSSDPDIYAAGDVARVFHPLYGTHIRVEHWANALNQPAAAARAMLGRDVSYDTLPFFYTDQYDLGMEYAGYVAPGGYDDVVVRGDLAAPEFVAFWLSGGRIVAGMNVNVWEVSEQIQQLITARSVVDRDRLVDPAVPIPEVPAAT